MPYQLRTFGGWTLLGPDGEPIEAVQAPSKTAALLAYLATPPVGEAVERGDLLPLLWPDRPEEQGRNALRVLLSRARSSLPEGSLGGKGQDLLWLNEGVVSSDVRAFERALEENRPEEALKRYRGPFLDRFHVSEAAPFNRWVDQRRGVYRRRAYEAALSVGEESREAGDLTAAEGAYRQALDWAPLKEEAAAGLMRVLADRGDRSDALQFYQAFRQRLDDELDLSPSAELDELAERVRSGSREVERPSSSGKEETEDKEDAGEEVQDTVWWQPSGRLVAAGLAAAVLGVGLWLVLGAEGLAPEGGGEDAVPDEGSRPTVAVLPFESLGGAEEARPFLEGLHSELLTRLATVDGLGVIPRTSVLPYREADLGLSALADSLGAEWILEGGIQQSGDRIQVNAQLIDPDTDSHAWAASYRRELTARNLFQIQEALTQKIVRALDVELTPEDERQVTSVATENTAAYELYLQAKSIEEEDWSTEESVARKIQLFRRAVEMDSTFVEAWAGLADALVERSWKRGWSTAWADSALNAAERAQELDPELARAHLQIGDAHWVLGNTERQLEAYRRAWELNPDLPGVTNNLAVLLASQGRYAERLKWLHRGLKTSPQPADLVGSLVETNVLLGRDSVADLWREYARRRNLTLTETDFVVALLYRGNVERAGILLERFHDEEQTVNDTRRRALVELYKGDWKQARGLYRRLYSVSAGGPGYVHGLFDDRIGLAWSLDRLGRETEARTIAKSLRAEAEETVDGVPMPAARHRLTVAHLILGDTASSLKWLEKAVDAGSRWLPVLKTAPTLKPLRGHPRFRSLLDRVSELLAEERREAERNGWGESPP